MSMELEIHSVQAEILRVLLFQPKARFSELNTSKLPTDHFTFHVKRLIEVGLIEKTTDNTYRLTTIGKEFANRFDTENVVIERQAKLSVVVCGFKKLGKTPRILVQQRLKQPYYGFWGFVSGKIKWGETIFEAAAREFKEETGLDAKFNLDGIEHKMDYSKSGDFLEDKYFFIIKATETKGRLKKKIEGGRNQWLSEREIIKLPNLFDDVLAIIRILKQDKLVFWEEKYTVSSY